MIGEIGGEWKIFAVICDEGTSKYQPCLPVRGLILADFEVWVALGSVCSTINS